MATNANKPPDLRNDFDAERIGRELDALHPNAQQLDRAGFLELFPHIEAPRNAAYRRSRFARCCYRTN